MFPFAHDDSPAEQQPEQARTSTKSLLPHFPAYMETSASAPPIAADSLTDPRLTGACSSDLLGDFYLTATR